MRHPAADVTSGPMRRSFGRRILRQLELLVPGLDDIALERPLLAPLVLVTVFSLSSAYAVRPFLAEALAPDVVGGIEAWIWLSAAISPVAAGVKALALGAVLWGVLVVCGRDTGFRALVSIFLYGEALLGIHAMAMVFLLQLRGTGALTGPEDLYVPTGLDALVEPASPTTTAVLQGTSIFHVAWCVFLIVALVRATALPKRWAIPLAAGAWSLTIAISGVRALAFA